MGRQELFWLFVVLPAFGAVLSCFLERFAVAVATLFSGIVLAFAVFGYGISGTAVLHFGFDMHLSLDTVSWFFMVMINLVGFTALMFSMEFIEKNRGSFSFFMLLALMGANGVVMSRDFLSLYIFWEIMSWSVFLLVLRSSGDWAKKYIIFAVISAVLLLMGIGIVYHYSGTLAYESAVKGLSTGAWGVALSLLIVGFMIKMAVVPLHVWAPYAYSSEQTFVAFLSGGLSKLGTFGILIAMYMVAGVSVMHAFGIFKNASLFGYPFALLGSVTAFIGTILAVFQDDIRKLLAYSSVGQLGYVMVGLGLGVPLSVGGALFHAFNHAMFKSILFMGAAAVFYRVRTYKISEMGGLGYKMPFTFLAVLVAIFALAGIPVTSGFISKWMLYEAAIQNRFVIIAPLMLVASVGAFLYCFRILYGVFLGQVDRDRENVKEVGLWMLLPMYILVVPLLLFAMFPGWILRWIDNILVYMNIGKLNYTTYSFSSLIGNADMLLFLGAFFVAFAIAVLMFVKRPATNVGQYDNYLSGEVREYVKLHVAYDFYKPLKGVWDPLLKRSIDRGYDMFGGLLASVFDRAKHFYTDNLQDYAAYVGVAFLIFVVVGWWLR